MRPPGSVAFAFVETRDRGQIDGMGRVDRIQNLLHPGIEILGPEDPVIAPAIHDEGRDMARHGRPVDVRLHRAAPPDAVAGKQKEPAERADLVELVLALGTADLDPVFLHQHRDEVPAIPVAVALDPADLVKERRQDPRIRVPDAGKGQRPVRLDVGLDYRLAALLRPLVQALLRVVDVAVVEPAVIRIEQDLPDRRTGAFRHDAIDHALALGHPCSGKSHRPAPRARQPLSAAFSPWTAKKQTAPVLSTHLPAYH